MEENVRSEEIKRYDALCKKILSEKGIIANIMAACVPEYRSSSISEIVNHYIE